ncbi:MAG: flagellar hook-basal body complex protein FliE [Oscillospiraceae bacterium]|nr:flagellar hook-basal body complex protein FliE [Oscillospiraceae bacterium]
MAISPITTGNFFMPIQPIRPLNMPAQTPRGSEGAADLFGRMFQSAVNDIEALHAQQRIDSYLLSIGEVDDIAAIELTAQKASVMTSMLLQVRNSLVDSYNEMLRMNI